MQLGSLNPLAEMVKLPWALAWPVVGPSSTETLELGTAPDPTMVSCPLIRLAWEVTIDASAATAVPSATATIVPAAISVLIVLCIAGLPSAGSSAERRKDPPKGSRAWRRNGSRWRREMCDQPGTRIRSMPRGSAAGTDQCLVADGGADPQPRLVQPALERGLADAGDLRGLLGGEPFDVAQHDGGAQRGRQAGQGLVQGPAQFAVLGLPGGFLLRVGGQFQFPRADRDPGRPAGPLVQRAVGLVHRDPVQPGEEAGLAAEPGDAPPGAQHDLLGHVLGFGPVAEQPEQQHEQAIGVRAGETLEGGHIAGLGASEQAGLGLCGIGNVAVRPGHHARWDEAAPPGPASRTRSKIV